MNRSRVFPLVVALCALLGTTTTFAGEFRVTSVSYGGWLRDTYQLVIVVGEAKYTGELDGNDRSWLIQTFLNDSYGNDLDDWANPDFVGAGKTGTSITPGMAITCDGSCAANGSIDRVQCGSNERVQYKGKAGVVIYHQYSPDIHIDYGQVGDVACIFEAPATNNPDDANSNPGCTAPELCTPIVLDLEGDGFRFTGLDEAVEFDLDADGRAEALGWTEGPDEAFLALDRNGNGLIDDGTELDVVEARRRDRHGNELRWASQLISDGQRGLRAVDVIFVAQ